MRLLFAPGRTAKVADVLIDIAAAWAGLAPSSPTTMKSAHPPPRGKRDVGMRQGDSQSISARTDCRDNRDPTNQKR
jgi:hypothetical protein